MSYNGLSSCPGCTQWWDRFQIHQTRMRLLKNIEGMIQLSTYHSGKIIRFSEDVLSRQKILT